MFQIGINDFSSFHLKNKFFRREHNLISLCAFVYLVERKAEVLWPFCGLALIAVAWNDSTFRFTHDIIHLIETITKWKHSPVNWQWYWVTGNQWSIFHCRPPSSEFIDGLSRGAFTCPPLSRPSPSVSLLPPQPSTLPLSPLFGAFPPLCGHYANTPHIQVSFLRFEVSPRRISFLIQFIITNQSDIFFLLFLF